MAGPAELTPPPGAAADWTIDQGWEHYTPAEHQTWLTLYERQAALLDGRACEAFLRRFHDIRGVGLNQRGQHCRR